MTFIAKLKGALGLKQKWPDEERIEPPVTAPKPKPAKASPRNPAYLEQVRQLPCCICEAYGEQQLSPTFAHHPIHGRFSQRRTPDVMAIPLCEGHHQGLWDKSKVALHSRPSEWKRLYGEDTEYIAVTQDRILK